MEFIGLVLINIFMGALFYFIISLKLEKSASEFRERKLRKEMEAIINEFNSAAERNITILEQKISVMKRLLERSGDIKSFNVIVDEEMRHNPAADNEIKAIHGENELKKIPEENKIIQKDNGLKKDLKFTLNRFYDFITSVKEFFSGAEKVSVIEEEKRNHENDFHNYSIEKEIKVPLAGEIIPEKEFTQVLKPQEDEIIEVFNSVTDKHSLYTAISDLHMRGCPVDDLSLYSGLPAGEIRLVLNLQGVKNI